MTPHYPEFTLQWHITHRCNLRCKHCYQEDYTAFSDRAALADVLDQYEAMLQACRFRGHLNITGGEPLLHRDLFWLLEEAREKEEQDRRKLFHALISGEFGSRQILELAQETDIALGAPFYRLLLVFIFSESEFSSQEEAAEKVK